MNKTTHPNYLFNLIQLNLSIILISTSGPLGRFIEVPIPITIGSRAFLAAIVLLVFMKFKKIDFSLKKRDQVTTYFSGLLMGIHWITYFYALQLSSVAIGMLSLFTFPVITAILEPLMLKTKASKVHLFLGLLVLVGIYFLVPQFDVSNTQFKAVLFGVFSAVCYAVRNIMMKAKVHTYNGATLMTHQLLMIAVCCIPFCFFLDLSKVWKFLPQTFLLAVLTTAAGHTLFVYSLKHFSAVSASILSCLQPVYGIVLGVIFLQETPQINTIIGGSIILCAVAVESISHYRKRVE